MEEQQAGAGLDCFSSELPNQCARITERPPDQSPGPASSLFVSHNVLYNYYHLLHLSSLAKESTTLDFPKAILLGRDLEVYVSVREKDKETWIKVQQVS